MAVLRRLWIFVLLFLFCLPSLLSIGLSGRVMGMIVYQPGKTIMNQYTILGANGPVAVALDAGPFTNITLSDVIDDKFDLIINFPENERIPTGWHSFSLSVQELSTATGGGIAALTSASKAFQVEVYSYQKEIAAELIAPSANVGTPITFQVAVQSRSYQDIDRVSSEMTILDKESHVVGKRTTDEQPLPSLSSVTLTAAPFPTESLPANEYRAQAVVFYDGQELYLNKTFKIGAIDVALLNYSSALEKGFNEFRIEVESRWGDLLQNVYAKVFLNEQELLQTSSISLAPWEKGLLKSIAKVDLLPGNYAGKIQLFFEGEMREFPMAFLVREAVAPEKPGAPFLLLTALGLGLLLLVALLFIFLQRQRQRRMPETGGKKKS